MILRSVSAAAVIALLAPQFAFAQEPGASAPGAAAAETGGAGGDIVVTARRRDESLSRVPVTVIALGSSQLEGRTITSSTDLQFAAPGLLVRASANATDTVYVIRGQSTDYASGSSPAVLPYTNDVQYSPGGGALYDLQSVQVLKGPQGTLFGRNTTGGAVLYETQKPSDALGGFLTARGGNLDLRQVTGAVDIPIVEDTVALRVAGDLRSRDGYIENLFNGEQLGRERKRSGRGTLVLKPTDRFENVTVYQYTHQHGTNTSGGLYSAYAPGDLGPDGSPLNGATAGTYNPGTFNFLFGPTGWTDFLAAHPGIPNMSYLEYLAFDRTNGKRTVSVNENQQYKIRDELLTNTTTYELSDNLTIKNIFGYGKSSKHEENDYDGSPFPILTSGDTPNPVTGRVGVNHRNKHYSNEFQISGNAFDNSVTYVTGLYYSKDTQFMDDNSGAFNMLPFSPGGASSQSNTYSEKNYAIYAQASVNLGKLTGMDNLTLTGGGRYAKEKASIVQEPGGAFHTLFGPSPESASYDKPSWNVSLEYQATSDLLLYVTNRGSWRSGGFNCCGAPLPVPGNDGGNIILPETTVDVEAGAKFRGQVGEMPTSLSVAVYNQWVKDAQKNVVDFFPAIGGVASITANVPKAEITGVEVDANISPVRFLDLGANVAYTDARYTQGNLTFLGKTINFGPYSDSPKWSTSAYAQLMVPMENLGELVVRGDLYKQTNFVFSNLNDSVIPGTKLPGYTLVNGRVELRNIGGSKTSVALFGKNIFNKTYYTGGLPEGLAVGTNAVTIGEPRTYGVELTAKF